MGLAKLGQAEYERGCWAFYSYRIYKAFSLYEIRNKNLGRPFPEDAGQVGRDIGLDHQRRGHRGGGSWERGGTAVGKIPAG